MSDTIAPLHWSMIIEALHQKRCVPFLGAGVNASSPGYKGLPLGGDVAIRLVESLLGSPLPALKKLVKIAPGPLREQYQDLVRIRVQDLARVALHVQVAGDQKTLISLLQKILPDQECSPSRLLDVLASLPLQLIVTTNFDRLMERALLKENGKPAPLVVVQPTTGFSPEQQGRLRNELTVRDRLVLYKIHGTFGDQAGTATLGGGPSVLISEEDYIQFLTVAVKKDAGVPPLISEKLVDSILLFLGYGLEDWDFRTIYKVLIEKLPSHERRRSFAIQKEPSQFWANYWASKQVTIYDVDLHDFAVELEQRYTASLGEQDG